MESAFTPNSFLHKLQRDEWNVLQKLMHPISCKKNSYVFRADELNDSLYILLDGRIKIMRLSQHGRELIQWFCLPGEIFGLSEDSYGRQRGIYAQAIVDSNLMCIQKNEFEQLLLQLPRLSLLIVKQLTARLRTLGDMLLNVTSDESHVRFIKLLQRLCKFYGRDTVNGVYIDIYLTHQEMADMIGVCRQTVSSLISKLKREGIIKTTRNGIYVDSPVKLHQMCKQGSAVATRPNE